MIGELAAWCPDRIQEVLNWSARDAIEAYLHHVRARAREDYRTQLLVWAARSPYEKQPSEPPAPPQILRES